MKKYLLIFSVFIFWINFLSVNADNEDIDFKTIYEENRDKFCDVNFKIEDRILSWEFEEYKPRKEYSETLEQTINTSFIYNIISWKYKKNMNTLYNCAIIWVQINEINSFLSSSEDSNFSIDKSSQLQKILSKNFEKQKSKMEKYKNDNCSDKIFEKIDVLIEATNYTCKYNFYMEYLKEFFKQNVVESINKIEWSNDSTTSLLAWNAVSWLTNIINDELNHTNKIFLTIFQAYSEFESNYKIHFRLNILKEMMKIYKKNLELAVYPINQVIYKVMNATSE